MVQAKTFSSRKINVVTYLLFHHLPSLLNQVKVGRIRRKMAQFDAHAGSCDPRGFTDAIRALVLAPIEC